MYECVSGMLGMWFVKNAAARRKRVPEIETGAVYNVPFVGDGMLPFVVQ